MSFFSYFHFTMLLCDVDEFRSNRIGKKKPVRNSISECSQKRDYTFIALKMSFVKLETLYVFFCRLVNYRLLHLHDVDCCFIFFNGQIVIYRFDFEIRIFYFPEHTESSCSGIIYRQSDTNIPCINIIIRRLHYFN